MPGKYLDHVRAAGPRVHCIANFVTANDCANLLLAVGACISGVVIAYLTRS